MGVEAVEVDHEINHGCFDSIESKRKDLFMSFSSNSFSEKSILSFLDGFDLLRDKYFKIVKEYKRESVIRNSYLDGVLESGTPYEEKFSLLYAWKHVYDTAIALSVYSPMFAMIQSHLLELAINADIVEVRYLWSGVNENYALYNNLKQIYMFKLEECIKEHQCSDCEVREELAAWVYDSPQRNDVYKEIGTYYCEALFNPLFSGFITKVAVYATSQKNQKIIDNLVAGIMISLDFVELNELKGEFLIHVIHKELIDAIKTKLDG